MEFYLCCFCFYHLHHTVACQVYYSPKAPDPVSVAGIEGLLAFEPGKARNRQTYSTASADGSFADSC